MKQNEQLGFVTALSVMFAFLAIPQVPSWICRVSGFLCPAIQAEDVSLRFFVLDQNNNANLFERFVISEPSQNGRVYGNRFPVIEAQYVYLDLSFRHRTVRLFSDFTINPVCFVVDSSSKRPIDCTILNFTLDSSGGRNVLDPKTNIFRKTAVLQLNNGVGGLNGQGDYEIILEIGGDGEAIAFQQVRREFSIF